MMYDLCVGQKWVTRGEFWTMPPGEVWWLIDAMMPKDQRHDIDYDDLYEMMRAEQARERAENGDCSR